MAKGQVVVRIVGDAKDLDRALGTADKSLDQFGSKAERVGDKLTSAGRKMTTFATIPIAAAMVASGKAASDLEQSVGGVESVFGDAADTIHAFGETAAETTGLSQRQVNEMAAVIGASLQGLGFDAEEAADQVVTLESRAADMAATFGGSTEEAIQAVSSALRGERDPIERYGVSIKEADVQARILALGLDTSTTAAEKKSKAIATLDLVMGQTAKTEGQFAREADGAAGSLAIATAEMENAAAEIGQHLLPLAADLAGGVADLASSFGDLPDPVQKAILVFAGLAAAAGPLLTVAGNVLKIGSAAGDLASKIPGIDRVSGSFGKLAKAGVAVGAAAAALQAVDVWAKASADNVPSVEKLTGSLLDLQESGELTAETLAITGENFEDLGKKIKIVGNSPFSIFDSAGIREVQEANQQIDALDKTLASLLAQDPAKAKALFATITEEAVAQGVSVETVNSRFNDYTNVLAGAENAQRTASAATDELTTDLGDQAAAAVSLDEALGGALDATLALFDADIAYAQQVNAVEDAVKAVTEATEGDSAAKLTNEERAEAQERAILDAETAILRQAAAAADAASKQAELSGQTQSAADKAAIQKAELEKVRDTLAPGSPLRARLDDYIARLDEVPSQVSTSVELDVAEAQRRIAALKQSLQFRMPGAVVGGAIPVRAQGGQVSPNKAYLVGERGPEVVQFPGNGVVVPNHQVRANAREGGAVFNIANVTVSNGRHLYEELALLEAMHRPRLV